MKKITINDNDYCKGCKLVDKYNELIDINNEHQKINGELREENKQLKDKITKAKEYMRDNMSLREYTEHYMNLMLILKGDSNE